MNKKTNPSDSRAAEKSSKTQDRLIPSHKRRRYLSPAYKARIVETADAYKEPGQCTQLLKREKLYPSTLTLWRKQYHAGGARAFKGGQESTQDMSLEQCIERLNEENTQLRKMLAHAELTINSQIQQIRQIYQYRTNRKKLRKYAVAIIEQYRDKIEVAWLCQVLDISRATFYRQRNQMTSEQNCIESDSGNKKIGILS